MSIASVIERIKTTKANIKTAIESKGVTIADDAKLSEYPDYISQISAGGGTTEPHAIFRDITTTGYTECETVNMTRVPTRFINGSGVKNLILNEGITHIYQSAIASCTQLTTISTPSTETTGVSLPSTLTNLLKWAFYACSKLDNIVLPKSLTSINTDSFYNLSGLITIDVEPEFNCNLPLGTCANVSQESVLNIITHYKSKSGKTLTLHANVFDNIPDEVKAMAEDKVSLARA